MSDAGNLVREARDKIENLMQRAIEIRRLMEGAQLKVFELHDKIDKQNDEVLRIDAKREMEICERDRRIAELEHQLNHDLHAEGRLAAIKTLSDALTRAERERDDALARIAQLETLCRTWRLGFALEDIRAGDMVDVEVDAVGWRVTVRPAKAGV